MPQDLEMNKQNAIAFYRMAYLGEPANAVELFVGAEYIQHNPALGDGKGPFIAYFEEMAASYPEKSIEFVRAVAEGDLVAPHTHQAWPGGDEYVTMDFFRFDEKGKILEHWDAMQEVPSESKNGNSMYGVHAEQGAHAVRPALPAAGCSALPLGKLTRENP